MPSYIFQNCIWSCSRFVEQGVYFQSAGFPICVTTVLGCSPCIFLPTVPTPLSGLNTYLGKYWVANHMVCQCTPKPLLAAFLVSLKSCSTKTEYCFVLAPDQIYSYLSKYIILSMNALIDQVFCSSYSHSGHRAALCNHSTGADSVTSHAQELMTLQSIVWISN